MEQLPKLARERLKTMKPAIHPDADLLTAFTESALKGREREQVLEHLAACADCREVVSLAHPQAQTQAGYARPKLSWYGFPALRWATAAALVLLVGAAVVLREHAPNTPARSAAQTSSAQTSKDQIANAVAPAAPAQAQQGATSNLKTNVPNQEVELSKPEMAERKKTSKIAGKEARDSRASGMGDQNGEPAAMAKLAPPVPTAPPASLPSAGAAAEIGANSESIDVTAATPAISTENSEVSKAKAPAAEEQRIATGGLVSLTRNAPAAAAMGHQASPYSLSKLQQPPAPRWTLSPEGTLQRSFDSGKTWQDVGPEPGARFRAVTAVGPEVWAGGAAGLLFHSSDSGQHWTRIKPSAEDILLTADIVRIEFTDAQHGKLTTADGQVWSTADSGGSWTKK